MNRLIKMAWRNIWRNKRRTLITAASIFFAVFFAIIMRSIQLGTYGHMIKQSIEMFTGYLQVQNNEYFDEKSLDNSMEFNHELINLIINTQGVKIAVPRVESFVLASTGHQSKGIMVSGIDIKKEKLLSNPEHYVIHYKLTPAITKKIINELTFSDKQIELLKLHENSYYNNTDRIALDLGLSHNDFEPFRETFEKHSAFKGGFLDENDDGVLVSSKLAQFLRTNVGDTIVLIGQGYHGSSAAGLFPVRGIVKVPSPDLDNKLIYMTLAKSQEFFSLGNRLTSIVVNITDADEMLAIQANISNKLTETELVVKNWYEVNPILKQQIESDDKSGQMFVGILYFIIFFGIFGTVLMMITERKREFGVMVAIGMRKRMLATVVIIEMFFLGLVGTLSGMIAVIPLIIWFNINPIRMTGEVAKMYEDMGFDPIMPTALIGNYFTWQGVIIIIMVLLACYIPLKKIRKMKVMESLRD